MRAQIKRFIGELTEFHWWLATFFGSHELL